MKPKLMKDSASWDGFATSTCVNLSGWVMEIRKYPKNDYTVLIKALDKNSRKVQRLKQMKLALKSTLMLYMSLI
jgi:hypothetical protein